jgi:hypothetical protein
MITDCWKPQAGGRMNRSSLVAQRLPIDAALDGRATRKLDRGGQVDGQMRLCGLGNRWSRRRK